VSELRDSAIKGMWWNLFNSTTQSILQSAQFLVLAGFLLPSDYGVVGLAYVLAGFLQVFQDMGFSAVIIQRPNLDRIQLSSLWWLNVGSGLGIFVVLAAASGFASDFYHMPSLRPILWALGGNFVLSSLSLQYAWICEKELRFGFLSKVDTSMSILSSIVAISLAWAGAGAWSIVIANSVQSLGRTTILMVDGWPRWRPDAVFRWSSLAGLRSFGFFQMGERTINYFNSRLDQLLLGRLIDATHLGYYSFGFNLSSRLSDRTNPIVTRIAFPVLSKIQTDSVRRKSIYMRIVHGLTQVNSVVHLGFAVIAPTLIALFFDGKWHPAVPILQVVAITFLLRSIGNPMGSLVLSTGRADLTFWWNVLILVITPITLATGAWIGHSLGNPSLYVALAALATQVILFHPAYHILVRPVLGNCLWEYLDTTLRPVLLGIVSASAGWLVSGMIPWPWPRLVATVFVILGLHAVLCYLFDHRRTMELYELVRRRKIPTPLEDGAAS